MAGYTIELNGQQQFDHALDILHKMPKGGVVSFQKDARSMKQNRKMWPLLQDIVRAKLAGREKYTRENWKSVFMKALGHETHYLNDLNGDPFDAGLRSSTLTKAQFADLITLILQFGDLHNVEWSDPNEVEMLRDLADIPDAQPDEGR